MYDSMSAAGPVVGILVVGAMDDARGVRHRAGCGTN
jgi:hypothetical protein